MPISRFSIPHFFQNHVDGGLNVQIKSVQCEELIINLDRDLEPNRYGPKHKSKSRLYQFETSIRDLDLYSNPESILDSISRSIRLYEIKILISRVRSRLNRIF